jgi:hypothetical protein
MTRDQIVGSVVISLVVGVFLIIVGAVLQPLLKRMWERMNAPSPLTPQTRGQLLGQLVIWEAELERLNYLGTHTKELFLHLFQVCIAAVILAIAAFELYIVRMLILTGSRSEVDVFLAFTVVLLALADVFFVIAMVEAGRMSEKKIGLTKKKAQKRIDAINQQLNPPEV